MAYDPATSTVVLFAGVEVGEGEGDDDDTWTWNGTTWTQQSPATSPSSRDGAMMAYDTATGNLVLFGGYSFISNAVLSDTWVWDGTTWTQQTPATSPSARVNGSMAYDAATGNLVLFGGQTVGNVLGDTWVWDGTTWTQQAPATSPSARDAASMAYDPATGNLVLFGGYGGPGLDTADTWIWNGTTWSQQTPATSPPARSRASMAYDAATENLVLFGGSANGGDLGDTWTWDGTTWTQQSPLNSPSVRDSAGMAYDTAAQNLVLFGGDDNGPSFNDTWTYQVGATAFPASPIGTATAQMPVGFTIETSGTLPLLSNANVLTLGSPGLDFTLGTNATCVNAVTAGEACTVNVVFKPTTAGQRLGAVTLLDTSGKLLATAYLNGAGTGPLATFTPGTISTLAGNGTMGYSPSQDGGPGTSASLSEPSGVAVDGAGNVYIADFYNYVVRKVAAATGIITTYAGTGADGYVAAQDGGPATGAELSFPSGVAVDGAGNLIIADQGNNRIRKVTAANGIITTIAGTGGGAYVPSQDGGPAIDAELDLPTGVAVDGAGNVYVADQVNNLIRKITTATGILTTVAGNGASAFAGDGGPATSASLYDPTGVAVDLAGNLYIADYYNNRVRKVTAATGYINTVAGSGSYGYTPSQDGGPATSASMYYPVGVAVDGAGNFYIADYYDCRIRKVSPAGIITSVAGTSTCGYAASQDGHAATSGDLYLPFSVAVDGAGNFYIADQENNRIRKVTATAAPVNFANTTLGNTSPTQTLIVNNAGYDPTATNPLNFPIPSVGNTNPFAGSGFTVTNSSTCPELTSSSGSAGTLAAGTSCTYVLDYQPVANGAVAHFLTPTDNSLNATNATQNVALTGSTGGLGVGVNSASAVQGSTAVPLSFTVGYGGNTLPTGTPTLTVNGSATGVGTITCNAKAGHNYCTATCNVSSLAPGPYAITATQPADSTYSQTVGTGTLTITTSGAGFHPKLPAASEPVNSPASLLGR